jgi:hypothetical protein
MAKPAEFLVSTSGQMSAPAAVRHRWDSIREGAYLSSTLVTP